jgi:hypothetical protein
MSGFAWCCPHHLCPLAALASDLSDQIINEGCRLRCSGVQGAASPCRELPPKAAEFLKGLCLVGKTCLALLTG